MTGARGGLEGADVALRQLQALAALQAAGAIGATFVFRHDMTADGRRHTLCSNPVSIEQGVHMTPPPLLEFDDVRFSYPGGTGLSGITLAVQRGDFVLVGGPSGGGKSTLLRLAVRFEVPASGVIRYDGIPVEGLAPQVLRSRMGLVQQTPTVAEGTVRDNLQLPFSFAVHAKRPRPVDEDIVTWLHRFRLEGVTPDTEASTLSVGQRQRLCCIRTLLTGPEMLLMDEPTSALDAESREVVEDIAEACNAAGVTILMVNHTDYRPRCRNARRIEVQGGRLTGEEAIVGDCSGVLSQPPPSPSPVPVPSGIADGHSDGEVRP